MAAQTLRASNGVEFKVYNVTKGGKQVVLLVDHSTGRRRVLNCADTAAAQKRANAIAAAMLKGQATRQAVSEADWQQAVVALDVARRNGTPLVEALKEWAICHAKLDGKATISEAARHRRCTPAGRAGINLRTGPPPVKAQPLGGRRRAGCIAVAIANPVHTRPAPRMRHWSNENALWTSKNQRKSLFLSCTGAISQKINSAQTQFFQNGEAVN